MVNTSKKRSACFELVTPKLAKEYLKLNVENRPLNQKTIDFYAEQIKKGVWKANGEAICFTADGFLGNGQHRLHAIIQANEPVEILIARGCDNDSFITYDSGRNRRISDVFALSGIKNYTHISAAISCYLKHHLGLRAITVGNDGSTNLKCAKNISKSDYLDEYRSSPDLYNKANSFSVSCYQKLKLFKLSEITGTYIFLYKDKHYPIEFIESFFKMMFFNENVSNNTISVFREKVIQKNLGNTKMSSTYKSQLFIKTWNAYVKGVELKVLVWNEAKEGKLIFL